MFNQHDFMLSVPILMSQKLDQFITTIPFQYHNQYYNAGTTFIRCGGYEAVMQIFFHEILKVNKKLKF